MTGTGSIIFYGFSTAAQTNDLNIVYNVGSATSGSLQFQDQASAGYAQIFLGDDGSHTSAMNFYNFSTAASSQINIKSSAFSTTGTMNLYDQSTAGSAQIIVGDVTAANNSSGALNFYDSSTAAASHLQVGDHLGDSNIHFYGESDSVFSTAGTSTILVGIQERQTKRVDGTLTFHGYSTADQSTITVSDDVNISCVYFNDFSTAASSSITLGNVTNNLKGNAVFNSSSTSGSSQIFVTNGSTLTFSSLSSGGAATISVADADNTGYVYFNNTSNAGASVITLGNVTNNLKGNAVFNNSSSAGSSQIFVTNGSSLQFPSGSSGGTSSIALSSTGTLSMLGSSSYTIASLTSDVTSLVSLGEAKLMIDYNGISSIEINGRITGSGGSLTKNGDGTILLTASCTYTGLTTVEEGQLINNGSIEGDVLVTGGTLSGVGTIGGSLTANGGTIAPGNSPGTITIFGNYTQNSDATYLVQVQEDLSSLIQVMGSSRLDHAPVNVQLLEGVFFPNHPYLILQAADGITGTFADPSIDHSSTGINEELLQANISYDFTKAFLQLQTTLGKVAKTNKQKNVAKKWDALINPNTKEATFLNDLIRLGTAESRHALDQLSGEPYANWLFIQERVDQQFLNSLYEPLRSEIISSTCEDRSKKRVTIWTNGGIGRSFLDSRKGVAGLRLDNYETSLGVHGKVGNCWTIGVAGNFQHDRISYQVGGQGSNLTWKGGLYSLYRPKTFYLLTNLISGYSQNTVKRFIDVNSGNWAASGKAKVSQVGLYAETGFDLRSRYVLLQPFLGIQAGHYHLYKTKEQGTYPIALTLLEKNRNTASSRLGIHLTGWPDACWGFFGIDCAWQCLLTSQNQEIRGYFQAFDDSFTLSGVPLQKNSIEGAVFIHGSLSNSWHVFAKASGQKWSDASTYDIMIGIETSW